MQLKQSVLWKVIMLFTWCVLFSGVGRADGPALTTVEVFPADINIFTSRGQQSFIVKATYADGITQDVTVNAKISLSNPALAKLEKNVITPLADGSTELKVEFGGKTATAAVKI